MQKQWKASWISVPNEPVDVYGVYLFRKTIELSSRPGYFLIHVSARNRYKLFVNGKTGYIGPARGDLTHWNFRMPDIDPYLQAGRNIVSAQVIRIREGCCPVIELLLTL